MNPILNILLVLGIIGCVIVIVVESYISRKLLARIAEWNSLVDMFLTSHIDIQNVVDQNAAVLKEVSVELEAVSKALQLIDIVQEVHSKVLMIDPPARARVEEIGERFHEPQTLKK